MKKEDQWIHTYTGKKFYPFDPRAEDICIEDIAHSLSLICRFNGHCREFYSVAQHSCFVSGLAEMGEKNRNDWDLKLAKLGLLHDAAEAYLGDISKPIKLPKDKINELRVLQVITQVFGMGRNNQKLEAEIKRLDEVALSHEKKALMKSSMQWPGVRNVDSTVVKINPLSPEEAEQRFLNRYNVLFGKEEEQNAG